MLALLLVRLHRKRGFAAGPVAPTGLPKRSDLDQSNGLYDALQMQIVLNSLDRRSQSPAARALEDLFRTRIKRLRSD